MWDSQDSLAEGRRHSWVSSKASPDETQASQGSSGKRPRRGEWWSKETGLRVETGKDFVPDSQGDGGDEFIFFPDSLSLHVASQISIRVAAIARRTRVRHKLFPRPDLGSTSRRPLPIRRRGHWIKVVAASKDRLRAAQVEVAAGFLFDSLPFPSKSRTRVAEFRSLRRPFTGSAHHPHASGEVAVGQDEAAARLGWARSPA